jgi:malate dehydrogenase (oxaloacetate-decarboxylating)(NADP+)
MPSLNSSNLATKLLQEIGDCTVIGPILCGFDKPVQVLQMSASEGMIINLAAIAGNRA